MTPTSSPPARIDSDLFDALTAPERQDRYPRNSRAWMRIDTSRRAYWHTLFDICPSLLELSGPGDEGLSIFNPFMAWAEEQGLSFDWSYYLWVYRWLQQSEFSNRLDTDLLLELMGASAARWAVLDRGTDCGIVLGSIGMPGLVAGWKCHTIDAGRQVEFVEPEEPLPTPGEPFGFFTVPDFELSAFPGWRAIPL